MYRLRLIALLTLAYLAMTANLQLSNIVVGLLLASGILALFRPPVVSNSGRNPARSLWALIRYGIHLIADLIRGGLQVTRILLTPSLPLRQGIIAIPTVTQSDLATALNAHAITLAPGELVVEIDEDDVMYTHCLDATRSAEYIQDAVDMRRELLDQIF